MFQDVKERFVFGSVAGGFCRVARPVVVSCPTHISELPDLPMSVGRMTISLPEVAALHGFQEDTHGDCCF